MGSCAKRDPRGCVMGEFCGFSQGGTLSSWKDERILDAKMKEHVDFVMGHELIFLERNRAWNSPQLSVLWDQVPLVLAQAGPSVGPLVPS